MFNIFSLFSTYHLPFQAPVLRLLLFSTKKTIKQNQLIPNSYFQTKSARKYRVTIGLQSCNCNRGYFCSHLLFVMLNVLNVNCRNPILWRQNLKNYEVEQLLKAYEEKSPDSRSNRSPLKHSDSKSDVSGVERSVSTVEEPEDEEACPICLQYLETNENLVICRGGCNNKLHQECMKTWALEREKRKERLMCPLCRLQWQDIDSYEYSAENPSSIPSSGANMPRASTDVTASETFHDPWLQPILSVPNAELPKERRSIPAEHKAKSRAWVQTFGMDMVKCG
eukprot:sb/3467872/